MKRSYFGLFILLLCCSFGGEPAKLRCHKTFTPAQLQEDFNILVTTLQEAHPDLYRVNSRKHIDSCIADIRAQLITDKTYLEFLRLIAPLFTEIGDINCMWGQSPEYRKYREANIDLFPLQFRIDGGQFINETSGTDVPIGAVLTSINGKRTDSIIAENAFILPTDGKISSTKDRWLEYAFPSHYSNFWEQPDAFEIEYIHNKYVRENATVKAADKVEYKHRDRFYFPEVSNDSDIAVLSISYFFMKANTAYFATIDSCFDTINAGNYKKLIIDLRGYDPMSTAGMAFGAKLFSYLIDQPTVYVSQFKPAKKQVYTYQKQIDSYPDVFDDVLGPIKPKSNAFHGDVYILADGWTHGARGYFCSAMLARPNTFYAGEECGACTFGMNCDPVYLYLPNSGIQINIPTAQYLTNGKYYSSVHGPPVKFPLHGDPATAVKRLIKEIRDQKK